MTRTILATIADDRAGRKNGQYATTQSRIDALLKASHLPITDYWGLTWGDIVKTDFYARNKLLLDDVDASRNGRAYKPYTILSALWQIDDGDFCIYSDVSPEMWDISEVPPEASLGILHANCRAAGDILVSFVKWHTEPLAPGDLGIHSHRILTTNSCIDKMDCRFFEDSYMPASGMVVIRKTAETVAFVEEWLKYCCDAECSGLGDPAIPGDTSYWEKDVHLKTGHRHDQSIMGLLLSKRDWRAADIRYNHMNPYNFLQYCLRGELELIPLLPELHTGDYVQNRQGILMRVWQIDRGPVYVVGRYEQSCYAAKREDLKLVVKYVEGGMMPYESGAIIVGQYADIPELLANIFDPQSFVLDTAIRRQIELLLLNNEDCRLYFHIAFVGPVTMLLETYNYEFFTDGKWLECLPVFVPYRHPRID